MTPAVALLTLACDALDRCGRSLKARVAPVPRHATSPAFGRFPRHGAFAGVRPAVVRQLRFMQASVPPRIRMLACGSPRALRARLRGSRRCGSAIATAAAQAPHP